MLFECETLRRILRSGIILPLKFGGCVISMAAHKRMHQSKTIMGIAFLTKHKGLLKRESAHDRKSWHMLKLRHAKLRIAGFMNPQALQLKSGLI